MNPRLCIFSCDSFHAEVAACIQMEGWTDAVALGFPGRCGRPPVTWDELQSALPRGCTKVIIVGRVCISALGQAPEGFPPVQWLFQEQCFHLIADQTLVNTALADGSYLMSPAWVRHWRTHISDQGFTPETAPEFYRDFAKQLVLLDTAVDPQAARHADEFSQALGLPLHRIAVGLSTLRLILGNVVLEWRLAQLQSDKLQSERAHNAELADHASALDLLGRLTQLRHETDVIAAIEDLFRMLFAPKTLQYLRVDAAQRRSVPVELQALQDLPLSPEIPYALTPDGQGFALLFAHDGQELGRMVVDGLTFVQYRERYLNLALTMSGVCALALESTRIRKRLVEAEKMASLGAMVAGVAHEINTPVGVGVLAASTLQRETHNIAHSFAQRSMTQSSLQTYFSATQEQIGLVLSNLERIGKLVDTFRKVAVNGLPQTKSSVVLARCIRDVIASLGERLGSENFTVHLACDEFVEIESYTGDWISIFTNLIINSLQHGFKNRSHGRIDITVTESNSRLLITYADDGSGISIEARDHIFDPFFTTDLQNGMGLGLHLVYNLVTQRMGGTISCESPPDKGALFHIQVPNLKEMKQP